MRFQYSTTNPSQNEFDSLPRLPIVLQKDNLCLEMRGLVDSGATVNVLPYESGIQLGGVWEENKAILRLAGNLGNQWAIPFITMATIGDFSSVKLVFAWVNRPNVPLILGQTNFFLEFDVCFYRSQLEFEIKPKA